MKLIQLISWKEKRPEDTLPLPGHDLMIFAPTGNESLDSVQRRLAELFAAHPEYKGTVKEGCVVEVSGGHTTMVAVFLEARHSVIIGESVDTTAHRKKQIKKVKKKRTKAAA